MAFSVGRHGLPIAAILLAILAISCQTRQAEALQHTHVQNNLGVAILASLDLGNGNSKFQRRRIPAGASDVDEYNPDPGFHILTIESTVDKCTVEVDIKDDESVSVEPKDGGKTIGFTVKGNRGSNGSSRTGCP